MNSDQVSLEGNEPKMIQDAKVLWPEQKAGGGGGGSGEPQAQPFPAAPDGERPWPLTSLATRLYDPLP